MSEIKKIFIKKEIHNYLIKFYLYVYFKNGKYNKYLISGDNLDNLFDVIATIMLGW